jgi:heat shock protein 4
LLSYHLQADHSRKDKANRWIPIPVNENIYGGMTTVEISEAHDKEVQLAQQDRAVELTKEKKNTLESYVYETRSKVQVQNLNEMQS